MPEEQNQPNADGTPPPAPVFDPAAFRTEMLGEFNKTLNGFAKTLKLDFTKMLQPPAPPAPNEPPPPAPLDPPIDGKQPDHKLNALELQMKRDREGFQKELDLLKKAKEETERKAEETDRYSKIRAKLGPFPWRDQDAQDDMYNNFIREITRDPDTGELFGADSLPYDKYIDAQMATRRSYALTKKDVNGSGAGPAGPGYNGKGFDMDKIKPGMSADDFRAAGQAIADAAHQATHRK